LRHRRIVDDSGHETAITVPFDRARSGAVNPAKIGVIGRRLTADTANPGGSDRDDDGGLRGRACGRSIRLLLNQSHRCGRRRSGAVNPAKIGVIGRRLTAGRGVALNQSLSH